MVLVLLLASTRVAWAQAGTASLAGTVKDSQGAVLPGATITVTNTATGATRTTVSNESGAYNLPGLPPGAYKLKVELSGFRTYQHESILLRVDSVTRNDAEMALGGVAETVTVTEATPIINTTDASVGNDDVARADSQPAGRSAATSCICSACSQAPSSFRPTNPNTT